MSDGSAQQTMSERPLVTRLILIAAIVATVGCDRVTKHIAVTTLAGRPGWSFLSDSVRFMYAENTGGFLGLGADLAPGARTAVFTIGTGVLLLGLVAFAIRSRCRGWPLFGLALFATGGASNWIDRAVRGTVVDFIVVGVGPIHTGIFNVADVAVMAGIAIFISVEIRKSPALSS